MKVIGFKKHTMEEPLRNGNGQIKERVIEGTLDLQTTNNELERAIEQRQQLEKELLQVSEREKRRIGEDLHDVLCQELTATALLLDSTAKEMALRDSSAAEKIKECQRMVNRNIVTARELARGLQAIDVTATGLEDALRRLAANACQDAQITCGFKAGRNVKPKNDLVAFHLYRVAQEAVNNAIKHSGAKDILVSLDQDDNHVWVRVQDDGKGFSLAQTRRNGLGLQMMRYRANALSGELKINRRSTGGTDVMCKIPTNNGVSKPDRRVDWITRNGACAASQRWRVMLSKLSQPTPNKTSHESRRLRQR